MVFEAALENFWYSAMSTLPWTLPNQSQVSDAASEEASDSESEYSDQGIFSGESVLTKEIRFCPARGEARDADRNTGKAKHLGV